MGMWGQILEKILMKLSKYERGIMSLRPLMNCPWEPLGETNKQNYKQKIENKQTKCTLRQVLNL